MVVDPMCYYTLTVRCWFYYSFYHQPCVSYISRGDAGILPPLLMMILLIFLPYLLFRTVRQLQNIIVLLSLIITTNWLLARYCYNIYMSHEVDIFTVYFLVWQFVGLIYKWLHQDLPIISFTLHQKATCLSMAFLAFITYEVVLRPLPTYVGFAFVWLMSVIDIVACFHLKCREYDPITDALADAMLFDYPTAPRGYYCVSDINEMNDDMENENECNSMIGWGDVFAFDLLLLLVIPNNYSITIRAYTAFGCIVCAQLGDLCTSFMRPYTDSNDLPAVPLPTIAVTAYAIAINAIIEYSNLDCEDPLK
ncbi:unnamed protein product [Rotaria socialis]|uniref:Uncharacterized protein n=2 Tax=Rotaria socialis TaxID=392032 RepID=A0A817WTN4_9BILA|nr:unnamed protein product [Rotaria socialis]CAF4285686.1 unnamed protein product [Rotaria socialis]CAF4524484.1 unnamed protein product [Rotaria socialis]